MLSRILSAVLLSLSLPLTGCVADELDGRGYGGSRYMGYAGQPSAYDDPRARYNAPLNRAPIIVYQQYPQPQPQRYRVQRQPVYYSRPVPVGYWPAPAWQGRQGDDGHRHQYRQRRQQYVDERARYADQYPRHEQVQREQPRGWTIRLN